MTELKPCPFCGCEAINGYYYDPFDGYQGNLTRYRIRCEVCGASLERNTKETATEAWNKRTDARDGFTIIDNKTGSYPDVERIALEEEWAKHLCYCDIDSFAITEDGTLILMDDCGCCAVCADGRFTVIWEG